MKRYIYKAKKGPREAIEGALYANSKQEAVDKIVRKGYFATSIREDSSDDGKSAVSSGIRAVFGVKLRELIIFTRQLGNLISSGVPILKALTILADGTSDAYFRTIIENVSENVRNGYKLSLGLRMYPRVFNDFYIAMVGAGEDSGSLHIALKRTADYFQKKYELISKVRVAVAYPALILLAGVGTLIFVFTSVIPKILPILLNLHVELPLITKVLIAFTIVLERTWMWLLGSAVVFGIIFKRALSNKVFQGYFSRIKLTLPLYGEVVLKSEIAQFARAVAMALEAGIPVIKAINISVPIINEYGIIDDVRSSVRKLESGNSLGESLKGTRTFPPFVYNLVKVGEETGALDGALSNIADTYESDCEEIIKVMTNLLEPVLVLIIGLIVAFIVFAVLLPILNLNILIK
ncbi:MAG: type II secretion system F family protein [Candidatus Omnitrophica bacterium]|nr:type II secretion system F family protein [Candidatus Omnitrophota bacterium]